MTTFRLYDEPPPYPQDGKGWAGMEPLPEFRAYLKAHPGKWAELPNPDNVTPAKHRNRGTTINTANKAGRAGQSAWVGFQSRTVGGAVYVRYENTTT